MVGRERTEAFSGGIRVENDPELLDEVAEEEVELLLEDDLRVLSERSSDDRLLPIAVAQGLTYVVTGLWPLVHMRSFEAVTGRKRERWLVKTVGLLVTAIGATLLAGARPRAGDRTMRVLGATSAAALAGVDLYYAGKRRIAPGYFADAALELAFVVGWLVRPRPEQ
jgi:hypothetical protein